MLVIKNKNDDLPIENYDVNELVITESNIKHLRFKNCNITKLIVKQNNIMYVSFKNCTVTELTIKNSNLSNLISLPDNLTDLDLSNNNIKHIYVKLLANTITLDNNLIETIEEQYLSDKITWLSITGNPIKNTEEIINKYKDIYLINETNDIIDDYSMNVDETPSIEDIFNECSSYNNNYNNNNLDEYSQNSISISSINELLQKKRIMNDLIPVEITNIKKINV